MPALSLVAAQPLTAATQGTSRCQEVTRAPRIWPQTLAEPQSTISPRAVSTAPTQGVTTWVHAQVTVIRTDGCQSRHAGDQLGRPPGTGQQTSGAVRVRVRADDHSANPRLGIRRLPHPHLTPCWQPFSGSTGTTTTSCVSRISPTRPAARHTCATSSTTRRTLLHEGPVAPLRQGRRRAGSPRRRTARPREGTGRPVEGWAAPG